MSTSLYWLRNDGDIQQHAASSAVSTAAARVITNFTLVHRDMLPFPTDDRVVRPFLRVPQAGLRGQAGHAFLEAHAYK